MSGGGKMRVICFSSQKKNIETEGAGRQEDLEMDIHTHGESE